MKEFNWKRAGIGMLIYGICAANAYIAGHATCTYRHVDDAEQDTMMRDKEGRLSHKRYIIEAFKDYGKICKEQLFG